MSRGQTDRVTWQLEPRPLAPKGTILDHRRGGGGEGRHRQANVEGTTQPVLFEAGAVGRLFMIIRQGRRDRQRQRLPFVPTEAERRAAGLDTPKVQRMPKRRCGLRS